MTLVLDKDGVTAFLAKIFPQVCRDFKVEALSDTAITMRLLTAERHLRPGGTVSGPSMFALADVAVYAMVMGVVGPKELAVTTNCSIDFMRKPAANTDIIAKGTLLKMGKLLAVGDVLMFSEGDDRPVARATLTYAIPPNPTPH